jgi:hypothetical protein
VRDIGPIGRSTKGQGYTTWIAACTRLSIDEVCNFLATQMEQGRTQIMKSRLNEINKKAEGKRSVSIGDPIRS